MSKPVGVWYSHTGVPEWAGFCVLHGWDDLRWAAQYAAGRAAAGLPFAWVYMPHTPPETWGERRAELDAAGVFPWIVAVAYREERYGKSETTAAVDALNAVMNHEIAALRQAFPWRAVVSIEEFFCPAREFGPVFYRPDTHCDIRAVECYVGPGQTWASTLMDARLGLACGEMVAGYQLSPKPVVLIPQGFRGGPDSAWPEWPTADTVAHTLRWAADPRVIATWPFEWSTQRGPDGSVSWTGYQDWPERQAFAALGVR